MALDIELAEIRDFLAAHPPFDVLPGAELTDLTSRLEVLYRRRGDIVLPAGEVPDELFVVRSGAVELRHADGTLLERGGAGTPVGGTALLAGVPQPAEARSIEDTLLLALPGADLTRLAARHPALADWFTAPPGDRLRTAVRGRDQDHEESAVLRTRVGDLVQRSPVTVPTTTSVREAARLMAQERISSVVVTDDGAVVGILTDRDLRTRVVAVGLDAGRPVHEVMTPDPVSGHPGDLALEVLLELTRRHVHHLPLVAGGELVGMITATDLLRLTQASPVHLVGDVARAPDAGAVAAVAHRLAPLVGSLVRQGTSARDVSRVITTVGDAIERRLLALAEAALAGEGMGGAPVPWAWVTLGSRARHEQALGPDQDHALVLDDRAAGAGPEVDAWFAALAERVSAGLVDAGYPRCRGEKMATNPQWRLTLSGWRAHVSEWVGVPSPQAVLESSVFFDLRHLAGDPTLTDALLRHQRESARRSPLFLAHLAGHAARAQPPLGFFRGLVVDRRGEHRDTLDLKKGGILPICEIGRLHALAVGSPATNTLDRLDAAVVARRLSAGLAADLHDAWEFLAHLRLRHQADQVRAGLAPDNRIAPRSLSGFEQHNLKAAFGVIRTALGAVGQRYPVQAVT